MISFQKLGLKILVEEPSLVETQKLVPVFHSWIQKQAIEDHLLIDVHDYSHINGGPGILLVAHEGNFSLDLGMGRRGLLYYRKQDLEVTPHECILQIFKITLQACSTLETAPELGGKLRFHTREILFLANDRLNVPNTQETFEQLEPALTKALEQLLGKGVFQLKRLEDHRERFSVWIRVKRSFRPEQLLRRLV